MRISVITRAYNRLEYTIRCISNAKLCMGMEFEHIIINNNSNDGTRAWLDHIQSNPWYDHVKGYHMNENLGDMGGRIFGATKARGDYLVHMDNDIAFLQPNTLPYLIDILDKTQCMSVMPLRLGYRGQLPRLSPVKKLRVLNQPLSIVQVPYPTSIFLMHKETFLANAEKGLSRCVDFSSRGVTLKVLELKAFQIDGWDPATKTYLQQEKYPKACCHNGKFPIWTHTSALEKVKAFI